MPSPFRILEILICALLGFLPYTVMMVYPFQNHPRIPGSLSALLAVFAAGIQTLLCLLAGLGLLGNVRLVLPANMVVFVVLFLSLVRAPRGKGLFTLFAVLNQAVLIALAAGFLEERLFPAPAVRPYSWAYALMTAGLQLLILTPCIIRWMKWYAPTLAANQASAPWNVIWLAPALCTVTGLVLNLLGLSRLVCTAAIALLSLAAWPVCHAVFRQSHIQLVSVKLHFRSPKAPKKKTDPNSSQRLAKLKQATSDPTVQLQQLQYCYLLDRIAESNWMQQELRRHVDAIANRLECQDFDKLRAHLAALQAQFPKGEPAPCCDHPALDPILHYFIRQAEFCGIKISMDIRLNSGIPVAGEDLAVLLGNLLDNALDACSRQQSSDRWIRAAAYAEGSTVSVTVENTFELPAVQDDRGRFLSTRHSGFGTGIPVCQQIAARYNGRLEIYNTNGIFQVTATLNPGGANSHSPA